jgi:hypothetical protein
MPAKPETLLQQKIVKRLKEEFPTIWITKIHGNPMQKKGLPDLIGCLHGRFFGLEVKMPGKWATLLQAQVLASITASDGAAAVVHDPHEAFVFLSVNCPAKSEVE